MPTRKNKKETRPPISARIPSNCQTLVTRRSDSGCSVSRADVRLEGMGTPTTTNAGGKITSDRLSGKPEGRGNRHSQGIHVHFTTRPDMSSGAPPVTTGSSESLLWCQWPGTTTQAGSGSKSTCATLMALRMIKEVRVLRTAGRVPEPIPES